MTPIQKQFGRWAPRIITVFTAAVFLDSLRFKFTNHPNTQEIFGRLNDWASSLGAPGLFDQTGLFSQYVIGRHSSAAPCGKAACWIPDGF